VSDKGRHHPRNEDAFHLQPTAGGGVVTVVCDGVSSSLHAEVASQAAADAAGAVLAAATERGLDRLVDATIDGLGAAQQAVAAIPWTDAGQLASPSCTLVSAACRDGAVAVGWVGDSRAYWSGAHGVRQLTVDNSWAEAQVESGRMTEVEADGDPRSHAITRWLGADAPDGEPQVATMQPDTPGRLLVCSDGLWNYAPTATQMTDLVAAHSPGASPIELARALTDFALESGGHDNITVVIIDLGPGADGA
jgi:serine/threonine protein phosphatase PrpC